MLSTSIGVTYAFSPENIDFVYNGKIYTYSLQENIKTSNVFNINYEINKYNRFGSKQERIKILKHMISIGLDKQIALEYLFPNISKKINSISKAIYISPQNAILKTNPSNENVFVIKPEIIGIQVDENKLIENVCNSFWEEKKLIFNIPTKTINPSITKKDFEKFTNLRSDFSTNIASSSSDRKHNIKNALKSLNKVEILPNQIFSFNKTVGKRSAENGYRQAKIIVNNEFVDGLGGGVCQVSSTLYNSALLAGLEIIEANKHSKQVEYVKYGFDAMVNFGSSDLKFRNNTSEKLTIITNFSSTTARIRIYGEKNNSHFKLSNEIFNIVEPTEEIYVDEKCEYLDKVKFEDEYFFLKKGSRGLEIKSYREKYINNILISKELLRHDKFKVQNSIKVYGNMKRDEKTTAWSHDFCCD